MQIIFVIMQDCWVNTVGRDALSAPFEQLPGQRKIEMKNIPVRKHPRLRDYDYNQEGGYFITFCTRNRHEVLGNIGGYDAFSTLSIELSEHGECLYRVIEETPSFYSGVEVPKFVIMPNHVHMIILINRNGAPGASRPTNALIPTKISIIKKKTNKVFGYIPACRNIFRLS